MGRKIELFYTLYNFFVDTKLIFLKSPWTFLWLHTIRAMSASTRQTLQQLCSLFCCPPCPEQIAAKLAFLPPDPPTYTISQIEPGGRAYAQVASGAGAADNTSNGCNVYSLHLTERAEWQFGEAELEVIEVTVNRTERGTSIAYIHSWRTDKCCLLVLYSMYSTLQYSFSIRFEYTFLAISCACACTCTVCIGSNIVCMYFKV